MANVIELSLKKFKVYYNDTHIIVEAKTWLHALQIAEKKLSVPMRELGKAEFIEEV